MTKTRIVTLVVIFGIIVGAGVWLGSTNKADVSEEPTPTPAIAAPDWCNQLLSDGDLLSLTKWTIDEPIERTQEPVLYDGGKESCVIAIKGDSGKLLVVNAIMLEAEERKDFEDALTITRDELSKIRDVSTLGVGDDSYFTNGEQGFLASTITENSYVIIFGQMPEVTDKQVKGILFNIAKLVNNRLSSLKVSAVETTPVSTVIKENTHSGLVMISGVPFTSQAPFGDWKDQRQQDGCEEASVLMAVRWLEGRGITQQEALDEILAIADFEEKNYGSYRDTNAQDTLNRIIVGYFNIKTAKVIHDIDTEDIKNELYDGKVVLVPVNGQKLKNPNFSGDGPERHMLAVIGFDPNKNEFIVNDPGTRKGKGYRYKESILQESLLDYPTGDHVPITGYRTAMIVIAS